MATTVVKTFDLYNTNIYWYGYTFPGYETEQSITKAFYSTQFSSNPIGSKVDFFKELAGDSQNNQVFSITTTIDELPVLWGKFWWDEAMYYSYPSVYKLISADSLYYRTFSESVGTLYYLTAYNTNKNINTKIYNSIIDSLLVPGLSGSIAQFYSTVNTLFINNIAKIGPGTGTDVSPGSAVNGTLIMANTDYGRRVDSSDSIIQSINDLYPQLANFLPFNTDIIGNLLTPYAWSVSATCEDVQINVDFTNTNTQNNKQLNTNTLIAERELIQY
jgi:hypothetical protein